MLDQEIAYALRLISADPGLLSYHDHRGLLLALLAKTDLSELPVKTWEETLAKVKTRFDLYQKNTEFKAGDDLIENNYYYQAGKTARNPAGIAPRRGKLLSIKLELVIDSLQEPMFQDPWPEDLIIDGSRYLRRYYIGVEKNYEIMNLNHRWAKYPSKDYYITTPKLEPQELAIWNDYSKIIHTEEKSFRIRWIRLADYQDKQSTTPT